MARTIKLDTVTHPSNSGTANQVLNASGQTAMPTVDINGGAIDNTTIGASTKAAGSFTTLTCSSLAPASGEALVLKEDGGAASITVDTGGSVTLANNITISGNSTIGDASGDTMTINATTDGSNNRSGITGEIRMFSLATPPTGWLVCNGASVNTYTYRALHAVISNTFIKSASETGTAYVESVTDQSGATTEFYLPDFRGRTAIGFTAEALDSDSDVVTGANPARGIKTLAGTGGADSHMMTEGEMPSHTHTQQGTFTSGPEDAHTHGYAHTHDFFGDDMATLAGYTRTGDHDYDAESEIDESWPGGDLATKGQSSTTTDGGSAHTHSLTISGATTSTGSDNYHNNLQPYLTVVYIIKT